MPTQKLVGGMDFTGAAAISPRNVWAVGWANGRKGLRPLIEHWNGTTWRIMPSPTLPGMTPRGLAHLAGVAAVSARNIWAVGDYTPENSARHRTLVLHWNGKKWKQIPSPHPGVRLPGSRLSGVTAVSARNVWVVGTYFRAAQNGHRSDQTLVLHWNGKHWRQVRSTNPGGDRQFDALYGVAAIGGKNIWAVGTYSNHGLRLPLVEHWNGHSWQTVPAPSPCPHSSAQPLTDLAALAPDDIWAAGAGTGPDPCDSGGDPASQALAEHWDGRAWSVSPRVNPPSWRGDAFFGIAAATPQAVWAVGQYFS